MPDTAIASAAPAPSAGSVFVSPTVAPYGLVRLSALPFPSDPPEATAHRRIARRLVACYRWCAQVSEPLSDALYRYAAAVPAEQRTRLVLPLRRDVHNCRLPKPAVSRLLGDLPERLPLLQKWLATQDEIRLLAEELEVATPPALAAERTVLAAVCRTEDLRRAVALTSTDLLRGIDRAAAEGATAGDRARKS